MNKHRIAYTPFSLKAYKKMRSFIRSIPSEICLHRIPSLLITVLALSLFGCQPPATKKAAGPASDAHAHDHGHEAHGPNGGHMIHLEPSDAHAEWTHDDDAGKIAIHLEEIVEFGKKIDSVKVELEIKGEPKKEYDFTLLDKGVYELISPELMTAIEVGSGDKEKVSAKLVVTIDGKQETALLEHHEHHH